MLGLKAGHYFFSVWGCEIIAARIDRQQKNMMRVRLEKMLELQNELDRLIETCRKETQIPEYCEFLKQLKTKNKENIQITSRYMITKCNR